MRFTISKKISKTIPTFIALFLLAGCSSDTPAQPKVKTQSLEVTASAYNSVTSQTKKGNPALTAWGDTLKPGMKAIAVSRDLIPLGLTHGTQVRIEGLDDIYTVLDKMNKRWTKKIDIYMGTDIKAAREWGAQKVTITWIPPQ